MAYARYGIDPANALQTARISPELLENPLGRVTAVQMEAMSAAAMQELDDEALGWFSRKLPWGSYGMLCRASLTSPNLGVALKRWCRHHRLLVEDISLHLAVSGATASISIQVNRDLGAMQEFCLVTLLRYMLGYACWVVDSRIQLLDTGFPFDQPPHAEIYPRLFPGPVRFNAEQTQISFDAEYLKLPLRRNEQALQLMLQRAIPLTVLPYRRDRLLVQRIRQILAEDPGQIFTAESLAERLHLSVRTLYRQLQEEGFSVQQLKDEARRDRAIELLTRTARPIKQIALITGFKNEKSFSRAFRSWTGQTPMGFRSRQDGYS